MTSKRPRAPGSGRVLASSASAFDRARVDREALAYLNRFDCSESRLRKHLAQKAKRAGADERAAALIDEVIERLRAARLLDDARFARNLAGQLGARGGSNRAIAFKLRARGVAPEVVSEACAARLESEPQAELEAARAYARKRRLGAHRPEAERSEHRRRDLACLARRGFSFEIAARALGPGDRRDDEF